MRCPAYRVAALSRLVFFYPAALPTFILSHVAQQISTFQSADHVHSSNRHGVRLRGAEGRNTPELCTTNDPKSQLSVALTQQVCPDRQT